MAAFEEAGRIAAALGRARSAAEQEIARAATEKARVDAEMAAAAETELAPR